MPPEEPWPKKYIDYLVNVGGRISIEKFDEDWDPVGPRVRNSLYQAKLIKPCGTHMGEIELALQKKHVKQDMSLSSFAIKLSDIERDALQYHHNSEPTVVIDTPNWRGDNDNTVIEYDHVENEIRIIVHP